MDGIELVPRLRAVSPFTEVVILTGNASLESAVRAIRERGFDYLTKPVDPPVLIHTLERAGERWRRRHAEATLHQSEDQLRRLFHAIGDAVFIADREGRVHDGNPAALALTGYSLEELREKTLGALFRGATVRFGEEPAAITQASEGSTGEHYLLTKDGRTLRLEVRTAALSEGLFVHTARDLTERRRVEEQMHRAERMEVVGRLAGGLAHDFNNVLTAITGYTELLAADLPDDPEAQETLGEILQAANRAGRLTKELLAFSRRQIVQPRILDLNVVIEGVEKMLRRLVRGNVEFETEMASDLGTVRADKGQIEQVLVNLVVNASDAMPTGGRLLVFSGAVALDENDIRSLPFEMKPGDYVTVSVQDTGIGMDEQTMGRIFDPFYTTKELGKGTGLGLSTVYGIVKQTGGYIHTESAVGTGTRFTIFLPRYELQPDEIEGGERENAPSPGGSETILLAEDDRTVRNFVRKALELHGYAVLEAASTAEALDVAERHQAPIHLLITDLLIPGMAKHGLADQMATRRPETPVILTTGHEREATDFGDLQGMAGILEKPFNIETLLREVRRVLDRNRA
jgi:PAS domain S-box-containing protein